MKAEHDYVIVVTTTESKEEAHRIAQALLNARLAACLQIFPIESFYHWEGKIERGEEFRLEIKTRREHFRSIEKLITDLHSYQVPEIIELPVSNGSEEYLRWIDGETGEAGS